MSDKTHFCPVLCAELYSCIQDCFKCGWSRLKDEECPVITAGCDTHDLANTGD